MIIGSALVAERVVRGVEFLDSCSSDWVENISLSKLDVRDPRNCVLGQLTPDGNTYSKWVQRNGTEWPIDHGFAASGLDGYVDYVANSSVLTEEWKAVIVARRGRVPA